LDLAEFARVLYPSIAVIILQHSNRPHAAGLFGIEP